MGAAHMSNEQCCCKGDGNGQRVDEDLLIQVTADPVLLDKGAEATDSMSDPDCPLSLKKPKIDKPKKAASFAASTSRVCKQQMEEAWVVLKGKIVAQKLIWINVPHRSDEEKKSAQKFMRQLDAVVDLFSTDTPTACLALEGLLIKHRAVLSKEILQAGERIKHLSSLTECRTELTNLLLARAGKVKKSEVLAPEDIEVVISKAELCDKRLAGDIKKLLTMMDCPSDDLSETSSPSNSSCSTASTQAF